VWGCIGVLALRLIYEEWSLTAARSSFLAGTARSIVRLHQGGLRMSVLTCLRSLWKQTLSWLELSSGDLRSCSACRRCQFFGLRS